MPEPIIHDLNLLVDLETTGIFNFKLEAEDPAQPRVASIGLILKDRVTLKTFGNYHALIQPDGWSMPQGPKSAGEVNGLTDEMLKKYGVPIAAAMGQVADWMSLGVNLVAHSLAFDYKGLRGELRRCKMPDFYKTTPTFCTMMNNVNIVKAPAKKPRHAEDWKWPTLAETYKFYMGKDLTGAHGSFTDCVTCSVIFAEMVKRGTTIVYKQPKGEDEETSAPRPQQQAAVQQQAAAAPAKPTTELNEEDLI